MPGLLGAVGLARFLVRSLKGRMCSVSSTMEPPVVTKSSRWSFITRGNVAGLMGGAGLMYYFVYHVYKNKSISVEILPLQPNHIVFQRNDDLAALMRMQKSLGYKYDNVVPIFLVGHTGTGKSILAAQLATALSDRASRNILGFPCSRVCAVLQGKSSDALCVSLENLLTLLRVTAEELNEEAFGKNYALLNTKQKIDVLARLLRWKLETHPNWVIVVDNVSLQDFHEVEQFLKLNFLQPEAQKAWSKGTLIVTIDDSSSMALSLKNVYKVAGLDQTSSQELLCAVANISPASAQPLNRLAEFLDYQPLALVSASICLRGLLKTRLVSIETGVSELMDQIESNVITVLDKNKHVTATNNLPIRQVCVVQTCIAMAVRQLLNDNAVYHAVNLLGSLSPHFPAPAAYVKSFLKRSEVTVPVVDLPSHPDFPAAEPEKPSEVDSFITKVRKIAVREWVALRQLAFMIEHRLASIYTIREELLPDSLVTNELFNTKNSNGKVTALSAHPLVHAVFKQVLPNVPLRQSSFSAISPVRGWGLFSLGSARRPNPSVMLPEAALLTFRRSFLDLSSILCEVSASPEDITASRVRLHSHLEKVIACMDTPTNLSYSQRQSFNFLRMKHLSYIIGLHGVVGIGVDLYTRLSHMVADSALKVHAIEAAEGHVRASIELEEKTYGPRSHKLVHSLYFLAKAKYLQKDFPSCRSVLSRIVSIAQESRLSFGASENLTFARSLHLLGELEQADGDAKKALPHLQTALSRRAMLPQLNKETPDLDLAEEVVSNMVDLSRAFLEIGEPWSAGKVLRSAETMLKNSERTETPQHVKLLWTLGMAYLMMGDMPQYRDVVAKSRTLASGLGVFI